MDSAQDTPCGVGCPIRRSRDQRSLASPPGFSQRATSFIASQCQGIHQMPFFALERHTQRQGPFRYQKTDFRYQMAEPSGAANSPLRRHFARDTRIRPRGRTRLSRYGHTTRFFTIVHQPMPSPPHRGCSDGNLGFFSPRRTSALSAFGSRQAGAASRSNLRFGLRGSGGDRARTDDPLLAKQVLSQLSYTPVPDARNQISDIRIAALAPPVLCGRQSRRF
jgi:hypothetical protein